MADEVENQEVESEVTEGVTPEETPEEKDENWAGIEALRKEREARKAAAQELSDAKKRLQEYEDRDKSDEEKRAEERARLESEIEELRAAKAFAEVAADTSVPSEVLRGPASTDPDDISAFAEALIKWRGEQKAEVESKPSAAVATIGQTPEARGNVPLKDQIAAAEASGDMALVAALKSQLLGQA